MLLKVGTKLNTSLKILKTEAEYNAVLERTIGIFHAEESTPGSAELDVFTVTDQRLRKPPLYYTCAYPITK